MQLVGNNNLAQEEASGPEDSFKAYSIGVKVGDREACDQACRQIISQFSPIIFRVALDILGNDYHLAEDISQLVLLKIVDELGKDKQIDFPKAWVKSVARHEAVTYLRKSRINAISIDEWGNGILSAAVSNHAASNHVDPARVAERNETVGIVKTILDSTDNTDFRCLQLRRDGLSFDEIAVRLGLTTGAAKGRAFREKEQFVKALQRKGLSGDIVTETEETD